MGHKLPHIGSTAYAGSSGRGSAMGLRSLEDKTDQGKRITEASWRSHQEAAWLRQPCLAHPPRPLRLPSRGFAARAFFGKTENRGLGRAEERRASAKQVTTRTVPRPENTARESEMARSMGVSHASWSASSRASCFLSSSIFRSSAASLLFSIVSIELQRSRSCFAPSRFANLELCRANMAQNIRSEAVCMQSRSFSFGTPSQSCAIFFWKVSEDI